MATKTEEKKYKWPKALGALVDRLYNLRETRLANSKPLDELEAEEKAIKNYLIDTLPKSEAGGIQGALARVVIERDEVATVKDWDALYAWIKKKNRFDVLNRAVNQAAIKELWEAGVEVPGVEPFGVVKVRLNKV